MRHAASARRFQIARPLIVAVCLAAGAMLGCSDSIAPTRIGGVNVTSRDGKLAIANQTDAPVFTSVIGREMAALVDWMPPCVDASACPPIAPGEARTVGNPRKGDGSREAEAIVSWWHVVATPNGLKPDSIRSAVVPLHW